MTKLYRTSKWKKARVVFIEDKPCDWNSGHSGPFVLDHLTYLNSDGSSMNDDQLMEFETLHVNGRLLILCRKCAYARRNNRVLCVVCGIGYHAKKNDKCFDCLRRENPDDYILCSGCGKNYHDKRYPLCFLCNRKNKRSRSASKGWDTRRNQGRKK